MHYYVVWCPCCGDTLAQLTWVPRGDTAKDLAQRHRCKPKHLRVDVHERVEVPKRGEVKGTTVARAQREQVYGYVDHGGFLVVDKSPGFSRKLDGDPMNPYLNKLLPGASR